MKILITGATGFIGRNLKEYLQPIYDSLYCPTHQELDLLDADAVGSYIRKRRFDIVVHCGITLRSVEENLKMYFHIERCADDFGFLINVGSGAEYEKSRGLTRVTEERFGQGVPSDIYGFSKYVIAKDIESHRRNIVNLRVFGIFGKYEDYTRRFISNNICRVLSDRSITMNRNTVFDYLYVDDFSRIVESFFHQRPNHSSYNICNGHPLDFFSLAEIIRDVDGKDAPIHVKEKGWNPEYTGDNARFLNEYGDPGFTDHKEAIAELYRWYKESSGIDFTRHPL